MKPWRSNDVYIGRSTEKPDKPRKSDEALIFKICDGRRKIANDGIRARSNISFRNGRPSRGRGIPQNHETLSGMRIRSRAAATLRPLGNLSVPSGFFVEMQHNLLPKVGSAP